VLARKTQRSLAAQVQPSASASATAIVTVTAATHMSVTPHHKAPPHAA